MTPLSQVKTLSAAFFFLLAGQFVFTYLPRFLTGLGWSATAAGSLFGAYAVSRAIAMPIWARLADRSERHLRMAQRLFLFAIIPLLMMGGLRDDRVLVISLVAIGITTGALLPLLDTHVIRAFGDQKFAIARMWGSAGFGAAAIGFAIIGFHATHAELASWSPILFAGLVLTGGVAVLVSPGSTEPTPSDPATGSAKVNLPILVVLGVIWFVHWMSQAPYNLFLVFLCEEKGFQAQIPGMAVTAGIAVEIIVLRFGHNWVRRFGAQWILALCIGVTAARWLLSAQAGSPATLVALQALHGLSFGAFFLSVMDSLGRHVPAVHRGTAQALLYVLVFGLGSAAGNAISGWVVDTQSAAQLFTYSGYLEAGLFVLAVLVAASPIDPKRKTENPLHVQERLR